MKKLLPTIFLLFFFGTLTTIGYAQNALNFDGIDDLVVTSYPGIGGNAARTVEAWIKTTAVSDPNQGGTQKVILDWGSMTPNGSRFTFNLTWANSIRIEVGGNGISGTQAVNDGNWHHLAASYDPLLTTNQFKLYIDGVLHVEGNTTIAVNTNTTSGLPLQIGRRLDGINGFNGSIDEVRVWNVARTASEIAGNMNTEFCTLPAGLVAYYKFNQGAVLGNNTGLTTLNEEVAGNNGTLQNFALLGTTSNWVTGSGIGNGSVQGPNIIASSCGPYTAPSGTVFNSSGTYQDTLMSAEGCDSILNLDITVINNDLAVSVSSNILTANQAGASYQWLDCSDMSEVIGATGQFFIATQNGSYAVVVAKDGCTDTTSCYVVQGIGVEEDLQSYFQLHPNPNRGVFVVKFAGRSLAEYVRIVDINGREMYKNEFQTSGELVIETSLEAGIYFVEMLSEGKVYRQKIVVQ